ncbi:hypothetical protein P7C73_g393, partial [Tremellales sp. Uapishka_1]
MTQDEPLLPVANRLESFWLTERDPELQKVRTTAIIPETADVVVIGSGLTGAMAAWRIYKGLGQEVSVVMLEADEVCGSATARNGGHCKPLAFLGYREQAEKHGDAISNELLTFEAAALEQYVAIVLEEDIDCDLHVTRAFDVWMSEDGVDAGKADWAARQAAFPESMKTADIRTVNDLQALQDLTGIKGARWGAHYPAGHLWPYKLATALIKRCIAKGMNLQTYTPATSLESSGDRWLVGTSRGSITAQSVIIATNAYTSSILPEFKPLIIPVRGTACSITPAASHSAGSLPGPLQYSYGLRFGTGEVDYMIPRQGRGRVPGRGDQSYILGGAKGCFLSDPALWYDNKRDDEEMPGARAYFEGYIGNHFIGWNGGEKGNVDHVWSGILGYSSDLLPYVGEVPDRPGVFICAGFTGHGMPRIPGCTAAISTLVVSRLAAGQVTPEAQKSFEAILPKPYWITRERLQSKVNLIKVAMGQGTKALEGITSGSVESADEVALLARGVQAGL